MPLVVPRILWGVTIEAGVNDAIRVDPSDSAAFTATIAPGTYYCHHGATGDADDLPRAVRIAVNAATGGTADFTFGVQSNGTIRITKATGTFDIIWTFNAATQALGTILGFDVSANDTNQTTLDSDYQHQNGWYPERYSKGGSGNVTTKIAAHSVAVGGQARGHEHAGWTTRYESVEFLEIGKIVDGESGFTNEALQLFHDDASAWMDFRYYPDVSSTTYTRMAIRDAGWKSNLVDESAVGAGGGDAACRLMFDNFQRYSVRLPMIAYTA